MKKIRILFTGVLMGIADAVPGVSGGTIAYISGIYVRWVSAFASIDQTFILHLVKLKIKKALQHIDFIFLFVLYCGVGIGAVSGTRLIGYFMHNHPLQLWGFFMGAIATSGIILLRNSFRNTNSKMLFAVLSLCGVVAGVSVTMMPELKSPDGLFYTFMAGFIAICAMVLPGISGAYVLVLLGKYSYIVHTISFIVDGIRDFASGNEFYFDVWVEKGIIPVVVFVLGIACGLVSFSKIVKLLFAKYKNAMSIFFSAFIVGTVPGLFPWRADITKPDVSPPIMPWNAPYEPQYASVLLFIIIGILTYLAFEYIRKIDRGNE